jgi:ATPase subunit of ABC transporter with duplicated ATPase domains
MPKKKSKKAFAAAVKKGKTTGKKRSKKEKTPDEEKVDTELLHDLDPDKRIKEWTRDIHIHKLSVAPIGGGAPLIMSSDIRLIHGHRYGLIGYNGAGKTTLLKQLASELPDIPKHMRVLHVHQELDGDDTKVIDTVLQSDKERTALLAEETRLRKALDVLCDMDESSGAAKAKTSAGEDAKVERFTDEMLIAEDCGDAKIGSDYDESSKATAASAAAESDTMKSAATAATDDSDATASADASASDETSDKAAASASSGKSKKKTLELTDEQMAKRTIVLTDALQKIADRLKFIEAHRAEERASIVLTGLGFTDRMKNMRTGDLSGGWLMRVNIACALYRAPDLLLLDEPTNHLDFNSVIWLTEYLRYEYDSNKIIMIVSHDRRFLNDVCSDIIHLESGRLQFYTGDYDAFVEIRKQRRIHTRKQYDKQQKMIKHNEDFIARFKANKKWSTQAQSRMKLLAKTSRISKVLDDLEFRFYFPEPPKLKNPCLVRLEKVSFGYFGEDPSEDTYLLRNVNLRLEMGVKVGILGANGAGKSTLLRLIMDELRAIQGSCYLSMEASVGYFAQHHVETLDFNATPLEHLKNVFGDATQHQIYAQLGRFSLGGEYARQKIGTLSGGQKARVAFAILTWYKPHVLIFDEPTNHLDLPTIDALAIALTDFEGSVILVSHDQHFVETVCDEYWAVGNRTVRVFDDFEKCRDYCFHDCKPVDVLPREFSTVEVKKIKYDPITEDKKAELGLDLSLIGKEASSKEKVTKDAFAVDPERAIDRGMEKGLTPDGILVHLKLWKPKDGNVTVVNKLSFIMFHEYYDKPTTAPMDFFAEWQNIFNHCVPLDHRSNVKKLVDVVHACWTVAQRDENERVHEQSYSFGMILECLTKFNMIDREAIDEWKEEYPEKCEEVASEIKMFEDALESGVIEDDSESNYDSSSD